MAEIGRKPKPPSLETHSRKQMLYAAAFGRLRRLVSVCARSRSR